MYSTWAEQELSRHLEEYAKGSDETERRTKKCAICGDEFDCDEGKCIELGVETTIRIKGKKPEHIYICNYCLHSAGDIEMEDSYE